MAISVFQAAALTLVSYILWRAIRPYVVRSPLEKIAGPPSDSWWKGNFHQVFDRNGWQFHHDIVEKYGGVVKLHNLFGQEMLYVSDPLALHHIVVKDQYIYEPTHAFIRMNKMIFGEGLVSLLGERHRIQRKMMNPVFSSKHMRDLVPILYPVAHQLRDVLVRKVKKGEEEINVMKWLSLAALEYIGQGGLGYTFEALDETKTNEYNEAIRLISLTNFNLMLYRQFIHWVDNIGTASFRRKVVELLPEPMIRTLVRIVDVINRNSRDIYQKKKDALLQGDEAVNNQVGRGKDIMSILLQANMKAEKEDRLPETELLGQMNTFILAAQETTTGAISRILHLLAHNPHVQDRLREEVSTARDHGGDLDYDELMDLPYLDAVVRETLRVYPPVSQVVRTARKDIVMPLMYPIKAVDGAEISEVPVKRNTDVIVAIIAANRSKKIWGEDAEEWKPERWLKPMPESVSKAHMPGVYASMMTFIGGGRACIGFKFAEMEIKMILSMLLEKLAFEPGPEIYWAMSAQASPTVKGQTGHYPQLPLKVSLVMS